jgi:hypothetical protein
MQERVQLKEHVSLRQASAIISRGMQETVVGGDNGYTLVKAAIATRLITVTNVATIALLSPFALPIGIATAVGALIYIASALLDQYALHREEDKKKVELTLLQEEINYVENEINRRFEEDCQNALLQKNFSDNISILGVENAVLLKLVLRNYLRSLGLLDTDMKNFRIVRDKKKNSDNLLPDQEEMICLIESVTRYKRTSPLFAAKVSAYLKEYSIPGYQVTLDFNKRVVDALELGDPDAKDPKTNQPVNIHVEPKQSLVDQAADLASDTFFTIAKGNTAAGLVLGGSTLMGLIGLGIVSWPVLIVALAAGILSPSLGAYLYKEYIVKTYAEDMKDLHTGIEDLKTRYQLLYWLNSFRKIKQCRNDTLDLRKSSTERERQQNLSQQPKMLVSDVPFFMRARTAIASISTWTFGFSIGALVGMSITSSVLMTLAMFNIALAPVLPPLLMITLPALIVATVYGIHYGYTRMKSCDQEGEKEKSLSLKMLNLKERFKEKVGEEKARLLNNTKQALLLQLISNYKPSSNASIMKHLGQEEEDPDILSNEERFLHRIADIIDLKRSSILTQKPPDSTENPPVSTQKSPLLNNKPEFYRELSLYLQQDKKITATQANQAVNDFRAAILKKNNCEPINVSPSDAKPKSALDVTISGNRWINKWTFPFIAILLIGVPLGFGLFGLTFMSLPAVFLLTGLIFASFAVYKFFEYKADQNKKKVANLGEKIVLAEMIVEEEKKASKKNPTVSVVPNARPESEAPSPEKSPRLFRPRSASLSEKNSPRHLLIEQDVTQPKHLNVVY